MANTIAMVMAGGKGSRLGALTCHRSKPALPFGGRYRIIDFVLSNFINSGYRQVYVLTQYMASSLIKHLSRNWHLSGFNQFIEIVPAQMRTGDTWYQGTADAVFQNLNLVRDSYADTVAVFGADHIYTFAVDQMEEAHRDTEADITVAAYAVPRQEAHQFGVILVYDQWRITDFLEKPSDPPEIPGRPGFSLVSMGNYIFRRDLLEEVLIADSEEPASRHDFGHNILPWMVASGADVRAYDFGVNRIPGDPPDRPPYWRDVGTIESYFEANLDLRSGLPELNLYNRRWRIRTAQRDYPPARLVRHDGVGPLCEIEDSLMCEGTIVSSGILRKVVLGYDCFVHAGAEVEESVILSGCDVGAGAKLRRVLFDKNCKVAPGTVIGHNPEADRERFPYVSESGVVVLPKGTHVPREGPIELAHDVEPLLRKDSSTRDGLAALEGHYTVSERRRHSHASAGPRYRRWGPGGVDTVADDDL